MIAAELVYLIFTAVLWMVVVLQQRTVLNVLRDVLKMTTEVRDEHEIMKQIHESRHKDVLFR